MKFAIITHAVHKLKDQKIYAYEPYVREMNLWLKYVDEVEIIAPVSNDAISSIESKYQFKDRHCEHSEAISLKEQIATSQTPRNDEQEKQITSSSIPCNDVNQCHPEPVEGCREANNNIEKPNRVGLDEMEHDSNQNESKVKSLRQAQTDSSKLYKDQTGSISSKEKITTSQTPRNDEQEKQNALPSIPCNEEIKLIPIPSFDITSIKNGIKAIFRIPKIFGQIYKAMQWADHIHLRCPGNVGLLGCFVQVLFPKKPKTIKYAGNWDLKSKQPLSYRLQKWIVSSTFLTKNTKVLVYGDWPNQSKNIVPFFTASYSEEELQEKSKSLRQAQTDNTEEQIATPQTSHNNENNGNSYLVEGDDELQEKSKSLRQAQTDNTEEQIATPQTSHNEENQCHPELVEGFDDNCIHFLFVGALTKGKQPLLSVKVVHELKMKGYNVQLNMYGEGSERNHIEQYIQQNQLSKTVILHGNAPKNIVKNAYKKAQFLLFISKSEGWPKVVAEAMFWGCLPISSNVSCIPYMLGNGSRGTIVNTEIKEIVLVIEGYLNANEKYVEQAKEAMKWSRQFTLEKFEEEIKRVLLSF